MKRANFRKTALWAALWLSAGISVSQVIEPPLPGTEGPARPDEAFIPLLDPGDLLPPESEMPEMSDEPLSQPPLTPAGSTLPELPPNLPDLDLDNIPGLVRPDRESALPSLPGGLVEEAPLPPGAEKPKRAEWLRNPREARKRATAEGKPLLLFFASSWKSEQNPGLVPEWSAGGGGNPTQLLRDDLTGLKEFNDFASERLVTCLLYFRVGTDATSTANYPVQQALQKFKTALKVRGLPCILMLDENGRELERISSYGRVVRNGKTYSAGHVLLDRLITATDRYEERRRYQAQRREELMTKGFREWKSRVNSTLFAKVVRATPQEVVMVDESRKYWKVPRARLSIVDLEWIRRKEAGTFPHAPPLPASTVPAEAPAAGPVESAAAAQQTPAPTTGSPISGPSGSALGAPPPDSRRYRP